MLGHGDGVRHCSNALSAQHDRTATAADRTAYRKWVLGIVVLCSTLLLISGVVAIMIGWNTNLTRLSTVSVQPTAGLSRTN
jgi:hypothetical protein